MDCHISLVNLIIIAFGLILIRSQTTAADTILPPRLSTAQKTIRVKEGQTKVVLECNLDVGDDPMAYRWLKQYKLVTADLGFAYRTYRKVHLALHEVTRQHGGIYECEAANDAGVDATAIEVIVEPGDYYRKIDNDVFPDTSEVLSELAASLNDMLAEGECSCDIMFLMHVSTDAPEDTVIAQANFVHTVATPIISDKVRISAATYSDYAKFKLSFGNGTNRCALAAALRSLEHDKWTTRIQGALRDTLKKFKKSKKKCKALFLPVFGSLGSEGANSIVARHLKKQGVKIFILEVTDSPIVGVKEMASQRGDGKPYHWWIPKKIWPTIVSYMEYMPEELFGCMAENRDIEGVCVGTGGNCTKSSQCQGIGYGCIQGKCKSLECNIHPSLEGCCSAPDQFWCGDVTLACKPHDSICDGEIQCMNGLDEERCWDIAGPCGKDEARCQSSTKCLTMYDLCDGEPHCPRAEDEDPKFCRSFPCPIDRPFRCRNGKCISTDSLCDGTFRDCSDGEDENLEYCSERHVCPATRPFKCDYGVCVPERMVCDGAYNCLDALDERLCEERNCPADRPFKCGDGKCVDLALVCNGVIDACPDGMDEANCTEFICPSNRSFKCMNGRCIDEWLTCDKRDDCGDNTDEVHCDTTLSSTVPPTPTLPPKPVKVLCLDDEFYCTSGACLPLEKVCDGRRNCLSGDDEDEELCRNYPCPLQRSYRCPDGACVNVNFCDGIPDCADAFDEEDCIVDGDEYGDYKDTHIDIEMPEPRQPDDDRDEHHHPDEEDHTHHTDDGTTVLEPETTAEDGMDDDVEILIDGKPSGESMPSSPTSVEDDKEPTTNLEDAMLVTDPKEKDGGTGGCQGNMGGAYFTLFLYLPLTLIVFNHRHQISLR